MRDLLRRLIGEFDQQFTPALYSFVLDQAARGLSPSPELYLCRSISPHKDSRYLTTGLTIADHQWESPAPDGLSRETRYWIDDMYMITILQVQAYRATGDQKYLDRAAIEMTAYLDKLQQPNGLFYHAPDAPFFWGRGNGWVAAGMTELLRALPANHPQRARIMAGYLAMMKSLVALQTPDGMWRQLLDHPEAWPESSSTGMFTFAMITGVKNGWLDKKAYGHAARKGWLALVSHIDSKSRHHRRVRGYGTEERSQLLSCKKAQYGRSPRSGTYSLVCLGAASMIAVAGPASWPRPTHLSSAVL